MKLCTTDDYIHDFISGVISDVFTYQFLEV